MRYTEVRMSKMADPLLADLDKETVDFVANYDETRTRRAAYPLASSLGKRLLRHCRGHGDERPWPNGSGQRLHRAHR